MTLMYSDAPHGHLPGQDLSDTGNRPWNVEVCFGAYVPTDIAMFEAGSVDYISQVIDSWNVHKGCQARKEWHQRSQYRWNITMLERCALLDCSKS